MLSFITDSWGKISAIIASIFFIIYTYLVKKNAKLDMQNESLKKEIEDIKYDTDKIITIQKKQVEIASAPMPSRDDLYGKLLDISVRTEAKH
jgi:hypothetical protein